MRVLLTIFALLIAFTAPASAADAIVSGGASVVAPAARPLPFPRTERAAAVWNERACWSQCGSYCAWAMSNCLNRDAQGICLDLTDKCDRACLRQCRTIGGPYLADVFDF